MAIDDQIPYPLKKMLAFLEIDAERAYKTLPKEMVDGIDACKRCKVHQRCDYFSESR